MPKFSFYRLMIACALLSWSCSFQDTTAPVTTTETPASTEQKPDTQEASLCSGPIFQDSMRTFTFKGRTWEKNGSTMTLQDGSANQPVRIGVLSDIKEDSPENIANLKNFVQWFTEKDVQLILVAGDTGETQAQIENALSVVTEAQVPVFAIIGNREGRHTFNQAMDALHKRHPNMFNLNEVRRIHTAEVDILSLPGYFNSRFIHAEDGCQYQASDLALLQSMVDATKQQPTLLVSHGGPKQQGPLALDYTSTGDNVGDPELARFMAETNIAFGVFGNIHEAGGKATNLAGDSVIAPNTLASSLYLNPGAADAVRWSMNDKSESVGMAAILTLQGGKASYDVLRISLPGAKKKAEPKVKAKGKEKAKAKGKGKAKH